MIVTRETAEQLLRQAHTERAFGTVGGTVGVVGGTAVGTALSPAAGVVLGVAGVVAAAAFLFKAQSKERKAKKTSQRK